MRSLVIRLGSFICSPLFDRCKARDPQIVGCLWETGYTMATKKQRLVSPPQTPPSLSPAISAVHSSPLGTGTLLSYPVTSSPFSSSPTLSSTDREPSPDYFDEFEYSQEMDEYLHRVDMEAAEAQRSERGHPSPSMNGAPVSSVPTPTPVRDRKTWVVFRGKVPGIYDDR